MRLTHRQLNRSTLARQLLLRREPLDVVAAVGRVLALQAQEAASPYIALWNRVSNLDPAELDRAFADQSIVKATLMRVTLHAVAAADYPVLHEAMQVTLRAARLNDRRFRSEGLTPADADALIPEMLAHASTGRTNADVERWLEARYGGPKPFVWWALRQYGPFVHAPTGGPWSFGPRPAYVSAPDLERSGDPGASWRRLVWRYLEAFGPGSVQDIGQFGMLNRPPLREALAALGDSLVRFDGPRKEPLYDIPGATIPDEETDAPPRLMAMWDSTLLAYADRSRIIPPHYRSLVTRTNGDTLPALLVDGYVAGVWRAVEEGIEATAFHPLTDETWAGLEVEARALRAFLAPREPQVYRRYARWWSTLPAAQVRVLRD